MDIRQLQTFMTVKDLLSFTKAADQLGYAQSSITAQVQQLESELEARLFERIGRSVYLTDAGARLVPYAAEILSLSATMKSAVSDAGGPSGTLTIGVSESLSISRLPPILSEYRRLYPGVDIGLKLLGCSEFLPDLARNSIDVAFAIGTGLDTDQTVELAVLPERILVLAPPGHPLARQDAVAVKDFENQALLLTGQNCAYGGVFMDRLNSQHVRIKTALETDSVQVIKQTAISGLGLCILPAVAVTEEIDAGKLVPLKFDTDDFGIVSQLVIHKDKWKSPALRAFLDLAAAMLKCT